MASCARTRTSRPSGWLRRWSSPAGSWTGPSTSWRPSSPDPAPAAGASPIEIETPRLRLRGFTLDDARFALRLLNEPSFLEHIGDKGVRTLEDAERYLREGPIRSYAENGHGLLLVSLASSADALGMCGLIRRPRLADVDLGYAFVPEAWGKGYALEAARAVLEEGIRRLGLSRVVAVVSFGNAPSIRLLGKVGFVFEGPIRMREEEAEIALYARAVAAPSGPEGPS